MLIAVVKIQIFKGNRGQEVGIHHYSVTSGRDVNEGGGTDGAERTIFADTSHLHAGNLSCKMSLNLFGKIVDRDGYVCHPNGGKSLYVVVYDCLVAYRQQRFGSGERHGTQTFTLATRHQNRADRKNGLGDAGVYHTDYASVRIKNRDEGQAMTTQ